jgi:hypothetical protein
VTVATDAAHAASILAATETALGESMRTVFTTRLLGATWNDDATRAERGDGISADELDSSSDEDSVAKSRPVDRENRAEHI